MNNFLSPGKSPVLSIDISANNLKYLWLKPSGKKWQVEYFGRISFNPADEEQAYGLSDAINQLPFSNKSLKKTKVVLGLTPTRAAVLKHSYPKIANKELSQMMLFDLQKEIVGEGETGEVIFDYQLIGPDPENAEQNLYLMFGAAEEDIDMYVSPFVSADIVPSKVSIQFLALSSLAEILPETDASISFLDIGENKSMFVVARNGILEYHREIMVGGDDFTKAITGTIFHEGRAIQLMADEANEFKFKYGYPQGFSEGMTFKGAPLAEIGAMMRPVVERLSGEIHRSVGFFEEKNQGEKIQTLYLVGGGGKLKNLPLVLSDKVDVPVKVLNIPSMLVPPKDKRKRQIFQTKFSELSICQALAINIKNRGNLLPATYKKIHLIENIHQIIQVLLIVIILVLGGISFLLYNEKKIQAQEIITVRAYVREAKTKEHKYSLLKEKKTNIKNEIKNLDQQIKTDERIFQIIRMLTHVTPEKLTLTNIQFVKVVNVEKKQKGKSRAKKAQETTASANKVGYQVTVYGEVENPAQDIRIAVAQMMLDMERSGYFESIELTKDALLGDKSSFSFILQATLKG